MIYYNLEDSHKGKITFPGNNSVDFHFATDSTFFKEKQIDSGIVLLFGEIWPVPDLKNSEEVNRLMTGKDEPIGLFNLVWVQENKFQIRCDRYQTYPIYYWHSGTGKFLVTNQLGLMVSHLNPEPDLDHFREKIWMGFNEVGTTNWKGIKRLKPGESLLWENGNIFVFNQKEPLWNPNNTRSIPELTDQFETILREQTRESQVTVALTGGMDSRLTYSTMYHLSINRPVFTHGQTSSHDIRIASQLAKRHGLQHITRIWPEKWLIEYGWEQFSAIQSFSPGSNDLSATHLADSYQFQQQIGLILVDSAAGELLRRAAWSNVRKTDSTDEITEKILCHQSSGIPLSVLSATEQDQVRQSVFRWLAMYRTYTGDSRTAADLFYLFHRLLNQDTTTFQVNHIVARMPFLHQTFLDGVLALDPDLKEDGKWVINWMLQNDPGLRWVLLDHAGERKPMIPGRLIKLAVLGPQRLLNKLTGNRKSRYILHYDDWIRFLVDGFWKDRFTRSLIGELTGLTSIESVQPALWNRLLPVLWAMQNRVENRERRYKEVMIEQEGQNPLK